MIYYPSQDITCTIVIVNCKEPRQAHELNLVMLGTDHLTSKGGVMIFFLRKYSDSQCCWKKYSDFGGGKKRNILTLVLSGKTILNETIYQLSVLV